MNAFPIEDANKLKQFINKYHADSSSFMIQLEHALTPVKCLKKAVLFKQGSNLKHVFFLPNGAIRYIVVDCNGKEVTKAIKLGPTLVGSTAAMAFNRPTLFTAETLHPLTLYQMNIDVWYQLVEHDSQFSVFYRRFLESIFVEKEQHDLSLLLDSPQKRYIEFLETYADHLDVIPQWMIATCLAITPEALSRIRKNMTS